MAETSPSCPVKGSQERSSATTLPNAGKCGCEYSFLGNIFRPSRRKRTLRIRRQALPYGLSKYVVLLLGCISIGLTSSLYYNWTFFEEFFMMEGSFIDLCTEHERSIAKPGTFVCDAQRREISNLYSVIMYTDSFIGSVGGYMSDRYGAYYVLVFGKICGIIAFLMFHFFCKSTVMLYVTFLFWGVSCSFALAPTWHYSRMFTFGNNMAVSVITAADNLSMFTPTLLHMIVMRFSMGFSGASLTYIFWAYFLSMSITLFFIPKRFIVEDAEEDPESQDLASMFNASLFDALKDLRFWLSVVCYVLLCSVRLFYRRSFTLLFFDNKEVTEFLEKASDLSFIGSFVLGYLNEYLGVVTMMSVTTLMYIVALVAVYFRNFTCAYTSALLFAIAQAGDIQQLITYIDEVFPEHESTLLGIANIINAVGGLLLQFTFNYMFDHLKVQVTVFLMILILIGVMLICYIIAFGLKGGRPKLDEPKKEEENAEEEAEGSKNETPIDESLLPAEEEDLEYNPSGPSILLFNIFSAFLNFPYYACLCIAVAINNIGAPDPHTQVRPIPDYVVRQLERGQFTTSCNRVVELCGTVFATSLVVLLGCMFEFSQRSDLMNNENTFLVLMLCLSCAAAVTCFVLPYTQIFRMVPPILITGLSAVPPLAMLIFGTVTRADAASFTVMCGLVICYGVMVFVAGIALVYLNSLMGARFGNLIHGLLGWSNLGMGYLYALLLIFSAKVLYTGDSIIGCYVIIMPMQCALCLFATWILYLHLSHEVQYFNGKVVKHHDNLEREAEAGNAAKSEVEPEMHIDYFDCIPHLENGMTPVEELRLKFRSRYATTWNEDLNKDYGLFYTNYRTQGTIRLSMSMILLAISMAITLADVAIVFLLPRPFVQSSVTMVVYFLMRMVFLFTDPEAIDSVLTYFTPTPLPIWLILCSSSIVFLIANITQLKWFVGSFEESYYIMFCIFFGLRLLLNALLQHHLLSHIERFKDKQSEDDKFYHAHSTVTYMNMGNCGGLLLFTLLCYFYLR